MYFCKYKSFLILRINTLMYSLNNLLIIFATAFIFSSCQTGNSRSRTVVPVDSNRYVAPAPGSIPKEKMDYYRASIKDYYINKLVNKGFNGGILVAKKGRIIFEDYHGYYNFKKKDTLTRHSAFHLASVSKTFTGMAICKLVQEGKISFEDSLQEFFPAFPYHGVRIKDLLSHRSGLPNYLHFMEKLGWDTQQRCTNANVLQYLIKYKPEGTGRPNTHFHYCNTNYTLLALVIEKASGKSYSDYLEQTFFGPLHMDDTYVFDMEHDSATAMPSYDNRGRREPYTFLDLGYGDKNIYSTPEDLLKWDQALYTNYLFTDAILEKAYAPYSNEHPGIRNYGYGWRMNVFPNGRKVIYHNGWWHGNNTVFIRSIQDSVTIIVLGNKYNRNIYNAKQIAEIFEGGIAIEDE